MYGQPAPRRRGHYWAIGIVLVVFVLLLGTLAVALVLKTRHRPATDPGDRVRGPHRIAVAPGTPKAGEPRWSAPGHRWVALSRAWNVAEPGLSLPTGIGLVSDGRRAISFREEPTGKLARISGYDGASGRQSWSVRRPWVRNESDPVTGDGMVIFSSGAETFSAGSPTKAVPTEYVALDTATGAERRRVRVRARTADFTAGDVRPAPAGALYRGVFYYGDGRKVIGVDARTGRPRYRYTNPSYTGVAGPIAAGGKIVMPVQREPADGTGSGSAFVFRPDLGLHTTTHFAAEGLPTGLMADGDILVISNIDGDVWARDTRRDRPLWHARDLPGQALGPIGRTLVVYRSDTYALYGYDLLTGKRSWATGLPEGDLDNYRIDLADGTIFALGRRVVLVDPATGMRTFRRPAFADRAAVPFGGLAVQAGGRLVSANDQGLTGYR